MSKAATVAVGVLTPAVMVAGIVAYGLWAQSPATPARAQPPVESLDHLIQRLNPPGRGRDAEWKALMRCIDQPLCDRLMDTRKADEHKRTLDRLKARPLDPTGNRVAPRPRWDWKQT